MRLKAKLISKRTAGIAAIVIALVIGATLLAVTGPAQPAGRPPGIPDDGNYPPPLGTPGHKMLVVYRVSDGHISSVLWIPDSTDAGYGDGEAVLNVTRHPDLARFWADVHNGRADLWYVDPATRELRHR